MKVVLRAKKVKLTDMQTLENHNHRKAGDGYNIDKNRGITNILGNDDIHSEIRSRIKSLNNKRKIRKDAIGAIEFVISASPEYFFQGLDKEKWDSLTVKNNPDEIAKIWKTLDTKKLHNFEEKIKKWATDEFGNNVVNLVRHDDEKTPHYHLTIIPIIEGKLNAKQFWRTRDISRRWQDSIGKAVSELGLERGQENSRAKHESHHEYNAKVEEEQKQAVKRVKVPKSHHIDVGPVRIGVGEKERENALKRGYTKYKKYYADNYMKHNRDSKTIKELSSKVEKLNSENTKLKSENETMRRRIKDEEIEVLREIDVAEVAADYLNTEIKMDTATQQRIKTDDYNIVCTSENRWYCNKTNKGGQGAISLLCDLFKFAFREAVDYLRKYNPDQTSYRSVVKAVQQHKKEEVNKLLQKAIKTQYDAIPPRDDSKLDRVVNYLTEKRKIAFDIVRQLTNSGLLYADNYGNCVFTNPRRTSAMLRGTSDKRFVGNRGEADVFTYSNTEKPRELYVFESPIDLLSYLTVKPNAVGTFVSINGNSNIAKVADEKYLQRYARIHCCTDNDTEGTKFLQKLKLAHEDVRDDRPPQQFKDWNEAINKTSLTSSPRSGRLNRPAPRLQ